jgi:hypothetical protein
MNLGRRKFTRLGRGELFQIPQAAANFGTLPMV